MWERLRSWVRGADPTAPRAESGPERWTPGTLPPLLAAVLGDPGAVERRAVYADWLLEQGEPLGAVINRELQEGSSWGVLQGYAAHLPAVLGDLRPVLQATRFELGLPVAGIVSGDRPDLLGHPQWSAVRHVQTDSPVVAGSLARCVRSFHVVGWPATQALLSATESVVERVLIDLHVDRADFPPTRIPDIALRRAGPMRSQIEALLSLPVRGLRFHTLRGPDPELRRRIDQHPTLERFVWRTGQLGRPGPVLPLDRIGARPVGLPTHLLPVRRVSDGLNRRFWLVHDITRHAAFVAALCDSGAPEHEGVPILQPEAAFGEDPRVELYRPDLVPLPPRPWGDEVVARERELVAALAPRVENFDRVASSAQFFQAADASLVAIGPVGRSRPPRTAFRRGRALSGGFAFLTQRGRSRRVEAGFVSMEPGLFALIDGESNFGDSGSLHAAIQHFVAGARADRGLAGLVEGALAHPWQPMGTASMVAVHPEAGQVAWIGDARAYLLGDTPRRLTRDHNLESADALGADGGAPTLLRLLGSPGGENTFESASFTVSEGDRILLCGPGLAAVLDDAEILALVDGRSTSDAVLALVEAAAGGPAVSVLLLDAGRSR